MSKEQPQSNRPPDFESVEELTSFARNHFAVSFPNPSRIRCPPSGEIEGLIKSGQPPSDNLREHMFECSECFNIFREQISRRKATQVNEISIWQQIIAPIQARPLISVVATLLIAFAVAGVLLWRRSANQATRVARDAAPNSSRVNAERVPPQNADPGSESAKSSVKIDLDNYSLSRRGPEAVVKPRDVMISNNLTRFDVTLPEGSPSGSYVVSIVDANDNVVREVSASSPDGRTLSAELDLRKLAKQQHRVCVSRAHEAPVCYPIALR